MMSNSFATNYSITWTNSSSATTDWTYDPFDSTWGATLQIIPNMPAVQVSVTDEQVSRIRKPPPQEFNPFINASDMMEKFIAFLGEHKVKQQEVMGMPIELFIKWLIIQACEADKEEPPADVQLALPAPKQQPRCLGCQRYLPAATAIPIHDVRCAEFYYARHQQAA